MKKILLTGMSGTGKATLTAALASRSYAAVDLDTAEYSIGVDAALGAAYADNEVKPGKD
ncbi:hypothetical protein KTO58_10175 [Chitinophaga pendula]|uniref:hypothetical protein n=1 Tax=Chitinophaga TaxID=79328 RepID=UPI0012FD3E65|nr:MULTISPECIES: hypothetical protein [Chitinophaga]UCJ09529.1 hypothetical protein KTO58_10175 [Chitinophaga pendula]